MLLNKMDLSLLRRKFRGCMLGALSGDCLGSAYEGQEPLSIGECVILQKRFDKLGAVEFKAPVIQYTDDSAMTKSLAESLIENNDLNLLDLAQKFVKSFHKEPARGYGVGVVGIFDKLRGNKFTDLLKPATEQFNGQGSLGNGAAMRVGPIALFTYGNYEKLVDFTRKQALITHAHKCGINGAILQAITVAKSLSLDPSEKLDVNLFLDDLIEKMDDIEKDDEEFLELDECEVKPFKTQLKVMKTMLEEDKTPGKALNVDKVIKNLGNSITALHSVPTAIFCFLYAQNPIKGINSGNPLRRALQYAITLGGDTDTIACMAGAIAGAYYGDQKLSPTLLNHCEASLEFAEFGERLFTIVTKNLR